MRLRRLVALTFIGFIVSAGEVYATSLPKSNDSYNTNYDYRSIKDVEQMARDKWAIEEEVKDYIEVDCELTFYTDLYECNGRSDKLTASGEKLNSKTLAVPRKVGSTLPVFPFGTKIEIDGYGTKIAQDTGSPKYIKIKDDGTYIFDVFVPRNKGENDDEYKDRIMSYGRVKTKAKVYYVEE